MKKFLAIAMAAVLSLSLAACGGAASSTASSAASSEAASTGASSEAASASTTAYDYSSYTGETIEDAVYQSDITTGEYLADSKCAPTNIEYFTDVEMASFTKDGQTHNYTVGGFMTLEELGIQIPSSSGIEGDYVMAYVAFPEGYDPDQEYPLIVSLPGNNAAI